ncbi:MAG: ABC transporter, permease protein [Candidatus Moranbacteria bacterium GW2011_GWC2_40_12]|nr:MAG: ABC transporter, permease protein [Candidatus Moranbacteria bacterium GW2011_GWC2_40_12]
MTASDLFEETYSALLANKTRTGLTMLGIIIGIGSVIAMVAIGQGSKGTIESNIQSLGSNLIIIMPGAQRGAGIQISAGRGSSQTLTVDDSDSIQTDIASIKAVAPELSSRYQVTAKGTNTNTQVVGTTSTYPSVRNIEIDSGIFISDQNNSSLSKVAVIGPTVRDDLFGIDVDPVGQTIRIKKIDFKIIGMTKSRGGSGFSNPDDMIFIPLSSAQRFLAGNTYVSTISVQANDQDSMTQTQADITSLLLERHHITDPILADFSILNQSDIIATASSVTDTLSLLLGAVASISLIVGGIGIMNMMLTTVTERTREIGLRKAIGAKSKDINLQFISEAIVLTFSGGVIGIIVGWLVSYAVSYFAGIATSVSINSILLAFGVSAGIGIAFGYYPARRASKLNSIEALRYE